MKDGKLAVVIGAGFGGLAAAIRLSVKGYRVQVHEKLDNAGGRASVFRQDGHTFDAGPTIITAPFLIDELFELCGKNPRDYVQMFPVDPFYDVRFDDGSVFRYSGDPASMLEQVRKFSPDDVPGYERFMERSRVICQKGFVELADVPFNDLWSMLRVAPDLVYGLRVPVIVPNPGALDPVVLQDLPRRG